MTFLGSNRDRIALLLTILSIVGFFAIGAASVRDDSLTIDETAHVVSGYAALRYGRFDINLEHPPLVKMVAALPLLFTDISYIPPGKPAPDQWLEGHRFLFDQPDRTDGILWRSRLAVLTFNALLFCALAILSWRVFGRTLLVPLLLFLLAFDPNILAHARYVTTDVPIALSIVGLVLSLLGYARQRSRAMVAWVVAFLALALLVKFSGLLAFGLGLACFVVMSWKDAGRLARMAAVSLLPLAFAYLAYFAVNVAVPAESLDALARQTGSLSATMQSVNRNVFLRPASSFAIGAIAVSERSSLEGGSAFTQFLDGQGKDNDGWRTYFPVATLYKETPAFFLLLCAVALFFLVENGKRRLLIAGIVLPLVFFVAYLAFSMSSDLNIGIRHFLPVLCLVPLICLLVLDRMLEVSSRHGRILLGTFCGLLVLLQGISVAMTYPYFLSYFNSPSGGWQRGYTHLVDSNLDWGEQLKRFSGWVYANQIPTIHVDYWGKSPLNLYDPENRLKSWSVTDGRPTGYFAVNPMWITHSKWMRSQGKSGLDYSYLESLTPVKTFGGGLWVYDLTPPSP